MLVCGFGLQIAGVQMSGAATTAAGDNQDALPGDVRIDRLIAMVLALATELAATRERLDTHERLLASAGLLNPAAIDGFEPDEAASAARSRVRQHLLDVLLAPLEQALDRELRLEP
jgi:hypothetical protein